MGREKIYNILTAYMLGASAGMIGYSAIQDAVTCSNNKTFAQQQRLLTEPELSDTVRSAIEKAEKSADDANSDGLLKAAAAGLLGITAIVNALRVYQQKSE